MNKLTDKEILDWLDSQTKKPHGWTINKNEFLHINNTLLTTCETERGQSFREAMTRFLNGNA